MAKAQARPWFLREVGCSAHNFSNNEELGEALRQVARFLEHNDGVRILAIQTHVEFGSAQEYLEVIYEGIEDPRSV
jgi:hypothetical protein